MVRNTIWSQKSNFVDVPTACPTRKRAGWTGDIAAFCGTGSYLMDIQCPTRTLLKPAIANRGRCAGL
jgi:alpha-L-rhamnosidase